MPALNDVSADNAACPGVPPVHPIPAIRKTMNCSLSCRDRSNGDVVERVLPGGMGVVCPYYDFTTVLGSIKGKIAVIAVGVVRQDIRRDHGPIAARARYPDGVVAGGNVDSAIRIERSLVQVVLRVQCCGYVRRLFAWILGR